MPLRHIAIPSFPGTTTPPRYPSYELATRVQSQLQQALLAWKAGREENRRNTPPPLPTLISFTPAPTYTLGRRQIEPLSPSELQRLRAPLRVASSSPSSRDASSNSSPVFAFTPSVLHAPRGGLTTYHGPGQTVFWPVIDLRSPLHAHFTVREYTCVLERTTIAALRRAYGIAGFTTSNPGVWVRKGRSTQAKGGDEEGKEGKEGRGREEGEEDEEQEEKISALGVHLRRHVTGLGVAVNTHVPVTGPEASNPWARIVACGLGDRGVTSAVAHLGVLDLGMASAAEPQGKREGEDIASVWAAEFASRLGLRGGDDAEGRASPDPAAVEEISWDDWEKQMPLDPTDSDTGFVEAHPLRP